MTAHAVRATAMQQLCSNGHFKAPWVSRSREGRKEGRRRRREGVREGKQEGRQEGRDDEVERQM